MKLLVFALFLLILFSKFEFTQSEKQCAQELKVLQTIWKMLGLAEEDIDKDPCNAGTNWSQFVECNCPGIRNATCGVTTIGITGMNLSTTLPPEFAKLCHLQHLYLIYNNHTGNIPSEWATMHLVELSLRGNRLSGPFPHTITRMTTLEQLSLEENLFSGPIPEDIARLGNLNKLILSSNNFNGKLPAAFTKLSNLTDLRISDNNFTGKIPNYIDSLTRLKILHIQGCSFEAPIPSSISALTELVDLRISDLNGGEASTFPLLNEMSWLSILILRNCFIYKELPDYLENMTYLSTLDLSFNNLSGEIPSTFSYLVNVDYMYLTENSLNGSMPEWVMSSTKNVDVSNNKFTWDAASVPKRCDRGTTNMVESYSSSTNKQNNTNPCLRKGFPCDKPVQKQIYSLHINCGGDGVTINASKYQNDTAMKDAYYEEENWAFSRTGHFLDARAPKPYIFRNTTPLRNVSSFETELYTTARTSPISLTYYGLCFMNGNYAVVLHFMEVDMMSDRIGKRIFDVYVQDELVLKNFDIYKEARGTGIAVTKSFSGIVNNNALKVQLRWAGKGARGRDGQNFGPTISAIAINPNFVPPNFERKRKRKRKSYAGYIIGGTVGGALLVIIVIAIWWKKRDIKKKKMTEIELQGIDLSKGIFTLNQIKAATNNFNSSNKLGEGGFGAVYKGLLRDGTLIAVKQLSSKSKQGVPEFVNEIGMLSAVHHTNLVRLYGCCVEKDQMSLIYEYMENNCLSRVLFGTNEVSKKNLIWPVRVNICIGIARGLVYLHEESKPKIIHRDIKASNILLDKKFNAKISDFGLAKLNDDDNTHVITQVAGTIGYMAPEYALRGYLTPKADVYSFGIIMLEIVSGKSNNYQKQCDGELCFLLDWALFSRQSECLLELVDPDLGSEYSSEEALRLLTVALLCSDISLKNQPTMTEVIKMLEGETPIEDILKAQPSSARHPQSRNQNWRDHSEARPANDEQLTDSFLTRLPTDDKSCAEPEVSESSTTLTDDERNAEFTRSFVTKSVITELT